MTTTITRRQKQRMNKRNHRNRRINERRYRDLQTPVPATKVTNAYEILANDGDDWEGSLFDILEACAVYRENEQTVKPVATVRAFFAICEGRPDHITRKVFIETCVEFGINKHTAATQYGHARTALNKATK